MLKKLKANQSCHQSKLHNNLQRIKISKMPYIRFSPMRSTFYHLETVVCKKCSINKFLSNEDTVENLNIGRRILSSASYDYYSYDYLYANVKTLTS
ncbi:hypothetical protein T4A_6621 [Trichinella pseudospiralis]|uniref:Uncharacterized protein n=1 Tax=Trichinella pseudospiralis TaxID=6337 RepID=A0A0V1DSS3_TRIPS|nr:hypothetical protein T4A_6621 [Trichinella pseudospiralis]